MSESGATWHGYWDRGTSAALFPHARQHSDEERPVDEVRLTRKLRREEVGMAHVGVAAVEVTGGDVRRSCHLARNRRGSTCGVDRSLNRPSGHHCLVELAADQDPVRVPFSPRRSHLVGRQD